MYSGGKKRAKIVFIDFHAIEERIPFSGGNLIYRGIYGWICGTREKEATGRS